MRKNAKCRNKNCKKITLTKNSLRDFSSGKPSAEQIFLTVCSVHQKASQSSPPAGGESIEIIFSGGVYVGKIPLSPPVCGASAFGGRSVRAADCDLHVGKARRAFPKKITPPKRSDLRKLSYRAFLAVSTRAPNATASVIASSERLLRFISMLAFFRPFMKRE